MALGREQPTHLGANRAHRLEVRGRGSPRPRDLVFREKSRQIRGRREMLGHVDRMIERVHQVLGDGAERDRKAVTSVIHLKQYMDLG